MHPYEHARTHPDRLALVVADTDERLTYRDLDDSSNRGAQLFRALGLVPGDVIGLLLRNGPMFSVLYWAAQRAGLMVVPLSTHLTPAEAAYILQDSGAKLLATSAETGATPVRLAAERATLLPGVATILSLGETDLPGALRWDDATQGLPATPVPDQISGYYMPYSSGTTGRPKGVLLSFTPGPIEAESQIEESSRARLARFDPPVTFNGAPLYHAAPLVSMIATQRMGGTAVVLRKFDAAAALKAIERWRVNMAQFVPTMFVRMLALPEEVRASVDLSSLQLVVHAAAPCPVAVKRRMMEWFGPILHEYYSGSEANGQCYITPEEWLRKPGSVGRAAWGILHICDDAGHELPAGQDGLVYFESDRAFAYLNDPGKTERARHPLHPAWSSLGDVGHVDEDGYLFLTDRKDFMIISGGVNIYPQAVEDALILHPQVADVAVIGVPNEEFGEEVKAIVQPLVWADASPALERALIDYCRDRVSRVSVPRSVDFVPQLPRLPTGKLAKHDLRRPYLHPEERSAGVAHG